MNVSLFIDERQDTLDVCLVRTIISCVEIEGDEICEKLEKDIKDALAHLKDIDGKQKFHFSDLAQDKKLAVVEALSKLDYTAKVWIHYDLLANANVAKVKAMRNTILSLKKKHSKNKLVILVEKADEYKSVIKESFMTDNTFLSILPDLSCYIMARKLDANSTPRYTDNKKEIEEIKKSTDYLIGLAHEHIRLQVFRTNDVYQERARSDRL